MKSAIISLKSRFGLYRFCVILLLVGIIVGALLANVLQRFYLSDLQIINTYFGQSVTTTKICYSSLLKYILIRRVKEFLLIWACSCIIFGTLLLSMLVIYKGICMGFGLASAILCYGIKGVLLYCAYLFPQCIIYIPVYILVFKRGYGLCEKIFYVGHSSTKGKRNAIKQEVPFFLVLFLFLLLGCVIETYINSNLVKSIMTFIIPS